MPSRARGRLSGPLPRFEDHEEAFFDEGHRLAEEQAVEDFGDLDQDTPRRGFFRRLRDAFRFARR
ncbi:MAG TPA: hypothetical protein VKE22_26045 [Haliangiales bacterium]|nr:hypothetical protein [Haliangiales bacterium]